MMTKYLMINVSGIVQGVGFRWYTQHIAQQHHLVGWVRNKRDGSVEICVQGLEEQIKPFVSAVEAGPGEYSHVDHIKITEIKPFTANDFAIKP